MLECEGIDTENLKVSEVHNTAQAFRDDPASRAPLFTVVRHPYKRFVSATLDRVVIADYHTTSKLLALAPVVRLVRPELAEQIDALSPEDIEKYDTPKKKIVEQLSFIDIARIISLSPNRFVENHYKSQEWFINERDYDYIFSMENRDWQAQVEQIIGSPLINKRPHATAHLTLEPGESPHAAQMTVTELRTQYESTNTLPSAQDLLTPEIRSLLDNRYKKDLELVASLDQF